MIFTLWIYNSYQGTLIKRLTHWGRVTHICVGKLIIIGSDNGLSPGRRQAIIWTNAGILLIGHLGTNFSEILIEIRTFSFKKMRLKVSSAKWRPFCLGLNVLNTISSAVVVMKLVLICPQRKVTTRYRECTGVFYYTWSYTVIKFIAQNTPQNEVYCIHPRKWDATKTYLGISPPKTPTILDCLSASTVKPLV